MFLASVSKIVRSYIDINKRASIISATLNSAPETCFFPAYIRVSPHWNVVNFGAFEQKSDRNVSYKPWILSKTNSTYETEVGDIRGGCCIDMLPIPYRRINLLVIDDYENIEDALDGFPFGVSIVDHVLINEETINRFDAERKMNDLGYLRTETNIYIPSAKLLCERMSMRRPSLEEIR